MARSWGGDHGTKGPRQRGGRGARGPKSGAAETPDALVAVEQAVVNGEERQLDAVGGAHLVEDVAEVVLYRVLAQRELLGDLLVRVAADHGGEDLQLARGQVEGLPGALRRRGLGRPQGL